VRHQRAAAAFGGVEMEMKTSQCTSNGINSVYDETKLTTMMRLAFCSAQCDIFRPCHSCTLFCEVQKHTGPAADSC
jgi:hypothetical protein